MATKSAVSFILGKKIKTLEQLFGFIDGLSQITGCSPKTIDISQLTNAKGNPLYVPIEEFYRAVERHPNPRKAKEALGLAERHFYDCKDINMSDAYAFI